MGFKLADLFVEITGNPKPLHHALEGVHHALHRSGEKLREVFGVIASGAFLGLGMKLAGSLEMATEGFRESFHAISDLNANIAKTEFVFGNASRSVISAAKEMEERFGIANEQFLAGASDLGLFLQEAGLTSDAAAEMSSSLVRLAADVKARKPGMDLSEILAATQSGLMGMERGLKRMGFMITEDSVKAEAARMGLAKFGAELSETNAVQARASLIMHQFSKFSGELERSQGSLGAMTQKLHGRMEELWETIGKSLTPAFEFLLETGIRAAEGITNAWKGIGALFRNFPDFMEIFSLGFEETLVNIGAAMSKFLDWAGRNWINIFSDVFAAVGTMFSNVLENLKNGWSSLLEFFRTGVLEFKWTPLLDGFKAVTEKMPDLLVKTVDMQPQIEKILEKIAMEERGLMGPPKPIVGGKFGPEKESTKKTATTIALEDFNRTLQEGALGKSDAAKTAENTAKLSVLAEQQVNLLRDVRDKYPNPGVAAGPA